MTGTSEHERAVRLLQSLGMKQYEAKAFVALTRLPEGTAKQVSEISEVPRTRVYDAVRTLESKGLVEIQHSSPQQFRAVSVSEAADTLRQEYNERTDSLRDTLESLDGIERDAETDVTHEVWSLSGTTAITNRTQQLVEEAERELVLVLGDDSLLTGQFVDHLRSAERRGASIVVGTTTDPARDRVQDQFPDAEVFVSGLKWLSGIRPGDSTDIARLLLVDRNTILVSTVNEAAETHEQAVFGRGFNNGLVTIVRRLMITGLSEVDELGGD